MASPARQGVTVIRTQLQYIVSTSVLLQTVRGKGVNIVSISLRGFQPNWSAAGGTDDPASAAPSAASAQPHCVAFCRVMCPC